MDILRSFISGALLHFPKISVQMSHSYSYDPLYRLASVIRERTIKQLLIRYLWVTTTCTASRARSNISRRQVCSSRARSTQATNSLILIKRQMAGSSNSTMFVISTTARKKLLRRARISTTDTSTLTMPTESLFLDTWMPLR